MPKDTSNLLDGTGPKIYLYFIGQIYHKIFNMYRLKMLLKTY